MMPHLAEFSQLNFRYPFRRYQRMALETIDTQAGADRKYHIVAPPGAGKTIVGLELIRRFGRPAVVFAPTTTIQQQWQEKVGMFTPDPAWIETHTSLDAKNLAAVGIGVDGDPQKPLLFLGRKPGCQVQCPTCVGKFRGPDNIHQEDVH